MHTANVPTTYVRKWGFHFSPVDSRSSRIDFCRLLTNGAKLFGLITHTNFQSEKCKGFWFDDYDDDDTVHLPFDFVPTSAVASAGNNGFAMEIYKSSIFPLHFLKQGGGRTKEKSVEAYR